MLACIFSSLTKNLSGAHALTDTIPCGESAQEEDLSKLLWFMILLCFQVISDGHGENQQVADGLGVSSINQNGQQNYSLKINYYSIIDNQLGLYKKKLK